MNGLEDQFPFLEEKSDLKKQIFGEPEEIEKELGFPPLEEKSALPTLLEEPVLPVEEAKPGILDRIKGLARDFFQHTPGFQQPYMIEMAKKAKEGMPERPEMQPPLGRQKGPGFFGPLERPDGYISTELSIGVTGPEFGGKETEIPLLVPTLTQDEIDYLLAGNTATPEIIQKAQNHALTRMKEGLSPFAQEAEKPQEKWHDPWLRTPKSIAGGMYAGTSRILGALEKAAQFISDKTGLEKGGLFGILAKDSAYWGDRLQKEGVEGIAGDVLAGLGHATTDIASIMALGPYGLPIHGGLMGLAEEGLPGAATGATIGALIHKILGGIGMLPSKMRVPAFTGFGAATTPGGVKERVTGGLTWAGLGLAGGSKRVTLEEFLSAYPKIQGKLSESKARTILKQIAPDITDAEIKEPGTAKKALDEAVKLSVSRKEPPEIPTKEAQAIVNLKPQPDGSVDVTMKTPREIPGERALRIKKKLEPRVAKERFLGETEMIKEAEGYQRRFEAGEDLTKLAEELRGSEVTNEILDKYAPDVSRRADTIKRKGHAKLTEEEFLREEKKAEVLEVAEEKLVEKEKAIKEKAKIPEITPAMKEIEVALKKGKELTEAQKRTLGKKYEYKPGLEKPKPLPEPEIEKVPEERMNLVNVSIKTPTGALEDLGEIPEGRIATIKEYAKKLGVGESLQVGTPYKGKWTQYLPPPEIETFMKKMVRDVKEQPKEAWEKWEYYSGYPVTKVVKDAVNKIREKQKIRKRVKLEEIKEELQKTDEGKVEWMYMETEMKLKEKRAPTFKKAFEGAKRALVDTSGNVKKDLIKNLGSLGKDAVIYHDVMAGADAKSQRMLDEAGKKLYKGLSRVDGDLLDRAIQSRRTVAVSKYRPEVKHPLGLTAEEHTKFLKTVPEEINKRADLYFKEMERVLGDLKNEGLISGEAYNDLKSKGDYSPRRFIQYIDPEVTGFDAKGRKISVPDSGIKALDEGSYNVMETHSRTLLTGVLARTQARIARNRANKAAFKIAKDLPDNEIFKLAKVEKVTKEGKQVYQKAPAGHTKIKVMIEGKARDIIMPDKYAREWVKSDPLISQTMATIIGWISGSKILKPMATGLNPGFALTNFPRDIAHVYLVSSEYSSFLPKFTFQIGRDFLSTLPNAFLRKGAWIDYINEGGGMSFLTHQGKPFKNPIVGVRQLQNVLGYCGETSEIWTRLALRRRAIRNGKSPQEATWEARNYLDFSQGGNVAKAIDTAIPYLNAGIQGTRGIFRALGDRPVDTLWKFAQVGTMATGLYLSNHYAHRENYARVTDREKVNNFIVMTPYKFTDKSGNERCFYLKVAKDQGQRIVCTLFENLMKKMLGEEVDSDQFIQSVQDFLPIIPSQNVPPTLDAIMGYVANKDFWTNKDIWKGEKITPREEYTIYTHPALVKAGKVTGLSPERLSYALSQVFTRGNIYTSLVSGGLSAIMNEMPEADKRKTTAEMVQKIPMIRRVFRLTPPYSIKETKELDKAGVEESTRKFKQKRELQKMTNEYYRKLIDEKAMDRTLLGEIKTFVKGQPKEDRKRLANWFKNYGIVYAIPDKSWWLNAAELTPEVRATLFWTKYLESDKEEKEELKKLGKKIPGFWSSRFLTRLRILMAKWKKAQ